MYGLCVNFEFFFLMLFLIFRLRNRFFFEFRLCRIKLFIFGRFLLDCLGLFNLDGNKVVWCLRLRINLLLLLFLSVLLKIIFLFFIWLIKLLFFLIGLIGRLNFFGLILVLMIRFFMFLGGSLSLFMCSILDFVSLMLFLEVGFDICNLL